MSNDHISRDQRGLGKRIKRILPRYVFAVLRLIFNNIMVFVPYRIKYGVATYVRKKKYPYSVIREGDTVVQVGAPKDILLAGRSRAVNFLRLVGNGTTVVVEPDEMNCEALETFARKNALSSRLVLCRKGAWSSEGKLVLLSNPDHPASNILKIVQETEDDRSNDDGFSRSEVPVDTLDNILAAAEISQPKLISITANGAEPEILKGLVQTLSSKVPYISLAVTGKGYEELMSNLHYDLVGLDDRGYTFRLRDTESTSKNQTIQE